MKQTICALLCALMLMGLLAGCQKTPDSPVVVGKNNEVLIEMAKATPAPTDEQPITTDDTAAYINLPLGHKLQIPETYVTDIFNKDGGLHLVADAAIRIPDTESMPLVRVGKADFQLPEIRLLLNGLYGDAPLYWNDYSGNRAQVMDAHASMKAHLAENGERLSAVQRENVKRFIETHGAMLDAMPEDDLFEPWNGELSQVTALSKVFAAHGDPRSGDDGPVYTLRLTDVPSRDWEIPGRTCFDVWGSENGFEPFINYYRRKAANPADPRDWMKRDVTVGIFKLNMLEPLDTGEYSLSFGGISMTPQDALAMANQLLSPFPNMVLSNIYYADDHVDDAQIEDGGTEDIPASVEAYILCYTQQTLNVPEIYIEGSVTVFDETKEAMFTESWGYPALEIAINDDGILSLWWSAPTETDAVLVQDAALLSYPEMIAVFEKMAMVIFDSYGKTGTEIAVDGMRLGLTRIRERNGLITGLLVPAWAFYGTVTRTTEDGLREIDSYAEGRPMLIINAVDGSIINPYTGY